MPKVNFASRELRSGVRHLKQMPGPVERPVQRGEPVIVQSRKVGSERAGDIVSALEQVEPSVEVAVAAQGPVLTGEEEFAHPLEMDPRLHLIGHLGKLVEIEIPIRGALGAVGRHRDAIEVQLRAVDEEVRTEIGPHRDEVLDGNQAAVQLRGSVVPLCIVDDEIDVRRDDAPGRLVILVGELPSIRMHVLQRRREAARPRRLTVVAAQAEEVVAVLPLFDEHLPVGHLD